MEHRTYFIKTFGCQMNEHDSQKIAGQLEGLGFKPAQNWEKADLILFNTCTVRDKAHHKAFSEIGVAVHFKKEAGQKSLIAVCGCVAQEEGARLISRFPEVDLVFGPDQIYKLPELIDMVEETGGPVVATELINSAEEYHFLDAVPATRLHGPVAFVTIMKGCNSRCSYCIVPKVRGTEVYRPAREIVREIDTLSEKGCKEVTLLGQNVNSYGTHAADGVGFAQLVRLIADNTRIERIRFTSPHPKDVKDDLIEEYATNPKLCSHIHLPLQSGSDAVLQRMRRAYNTKIYFSKVEKLRAARPDIAITADMIAGFPGETEEEFEQTLFFTEKTGFDDLFAFKYSPRPDTEAFGFADDVSTAIKEERLSKLLTLQAKISKSKNEAYVGKTEAVLVEGSDKKGSGLMGRNSANKAINFAGPENRLGCIVKVVVTKANVHSLEGRLLS